MERIGAIAPGHRDGRRARGRRDVRARRAARRRRSPLGGAQVLSLKDEAVALLRETPGLRLPIDLLLYAKTLSYVFSLGAELAPEVDMMKLSVPSLLRFLAEKDAA